MSHGAPSVCLCMIVKNESNVLRRCLDSVVRYIDHWVICDTGSTDGTQSLVREFFSSRGVPGTLHETPWVDFGRNRTLCLQRARSTADFLLMLDADEVLVHRRGVHPFRGMLTAHHVYTIAMDGPLYYRVPVVTRGDTEWAYAGVTHEHLVVDRSRHRVCAWGGFTLRHHADGGNRSEKFTRDVALLLEGIRDEPTNARYHFYLAESYNNMKRPADAIPWYTKRVAMGGWAEEVYYSKLQLARCTHLLHPSDDGFESTILPLYMAAFHYRPSRLEALYQVVLFYSKRGAHARALGYGMLAYPACVSTHIPNDILFLTRSIYTHAFPAVMANAAAHLPGVMLDRHSLA